MRVATALAAPGIHSMRALQCRSQGALTRPAHDSAASAGLDGVPLEAGPACPPPYHSKQQMEETRERTVYGMQDAQLNEMFINHFCALAAAASSAGCQVRAAGELVSICLLRRSVTRRLAGRLCLCRPWVLVRALSPALHPRAAAILMCRRDSWC